MDDYSIDEIVERIEDEYGFISKIKNSGSVSTITFLIDAITDINLILSLKETSRGYAIQEYEIEFPSKTVDIKDTTIILEAYQSAIEVVFLINESLENMGVID